MLIYTVLNIQALFWGDQRLLYGITSQRNKSKAEVWFLWTVEPINLLEEPWKRSCSRHQFKKKKKTSVRPSWWSLVNIWGHRKTKKKEWRLACIERKKPSFLLFTSLLLSPVQQVQLQREKPWKMDECVSLSCSHSLLSFTFTHPLFLPHCSLIMCGCNIFILPVMRMKTTFFFFLFSSQRIVS